MRLAAYFDGFECRFIDVPIQWFRLFFRGSELAYEADGAHDAECILLETLFRISDCADDFSRYQPDHRTDR